MLESILELLLAEENEKAEELLHEYVVDKAREQYESLLNDEVEEEEEVTEVIDQSNDFEDDIVANDEEITADEIGEEDDEEAGDELPFGDDESEDEVEGEEDLEDKVDDIASELESLKAEFDALMADGDEPEVELGDEEAGELDSLGGEEELDLESVEYDLDEDKDEDEDEVVEEATKFSDSVAAPKAGEADSSESPFTKAPKQTKVAGAGQPVKAKDGSDGVKDAKATDHTPTDNIKVEPKKA